VTTRCTLADALALLGLDVRDERSLCFADHRVRCEAPAVAALAKWFTEPHAPGDLVTVHRTLDGPVGRNALGIAFRLGTMQSHVVSSESYCNQVLLLIQLGGAVFRHLWFFATNQLLDRGRLFKKSVRNQIMAKGYSTHESLTARR